MFSRSITTPVREGGNLLQNNKDAVISKLLSHVFLPSSNSTTAEDMYNKMVVSRVNKKKVSKAIPEKQIYEAKQK